MMNDSVSLYTIRRLPLYLEFLKELKAADVEFTSASEIARNLKIYPTQVRKDLTIAGLTGKPRVGHKVDESIILIEEFLGWDHSLNTVVVGAGNLARALLRYHDMNVTGLSIKALTDNDPAKFGTHVKGLKVYSNDDLAKIRDEFDIQVGIIATPASEAQNAADMLIENKITTLWNFTTVRIKVPENVFVEQTCLYCNMAVVTYHHNKRNLIEYK